MPAVERIGRYELVSHLASGGMGHVYLARFGGLGGFERHVVLKTLDLQGVDADEDDAVAMFLDEARLLGLLHHQHITPVFEVGRDEGRLYLVMDYIHGHTAHDVWQRTLEIGAALPIDFSLTVASAAASGLHYAHTRRGPDGKQLHIVHRDVTLSNLMIGFDGDVKLIDFGIAKAANRSVHTQVGFVKGKVGYMAPEQIRGQGVDARTDVFSLGIVLYELTTMRRAFRDESDRATIERIKNGSFAAPSTIVPDYPPELEHIVTRALRVDPRERYPDTESMRRSLEALGHRFKLVLGDAAIVEIMAQLFEHRAEPWQAQPQTRAETELEVPLELVPSQVFDDESTRPTTSPIKGLRAATPNPLRAATPNQLRPETPRPLRAATEAADALVIEQIKIGTQPVPAIATPVVQLTPVHRTEHIARRRKPMPAAARGWIAAGVVLAGAIVACLYDVSDSPEISVASAAQSPATPVDAAVATDRASPVDAQPTASKPEAAGVRLQITSIPSDATVLLDGKRLGKTPLDVTVDALPGKHALKIRSRGYVSQHLDIELTSDVTHEFKLKRAASESAAER
jgi:serine/threonine-protein kinase